jgi:hypothetical protein
MRKTELGDGRASGVCRRCIVLIDLETVGPSDEMLRQLAEEFPDICNVVLSPFDAETYAAEAWEVIVEPAPLLDLLAALESANEFHRELVDPLRREARIEAVIREVRQCGMAPSPGQPARE